MRDRLTHDQAQAWADGLAADFSAGRIAAVAARFAPNAAAFSTEAIYHLSTPEVQREVISDLRAQIAAKGIERMTARVIAVGLRFGRQFRVILEWRYFDAAGALRATARATYHLSADTDPPLIERLHYDTPGLALADPDAVRHRVFPATGEASGTDQGDDDGDGDGDDLGMPPPGPKGSCGSSGSTGATG